MKNIENSLPFKVVKQWEEKFYSMPNAFLNGYCKEVGWQGHIVYSALWRHANKGICFPSLKHLADELGVGLSSVQKGINKLKKYKIIAVRTRTKKGGGRASNIYYLLDKNAWEPVFRWSNRGVKKKRE